MTPRRQPEPWSDERLEAAFRARFDAGPPNGLTQRVVDELGPSAPGRRWLWPAPRRRGGWMTSPLTGLAVLGLALIAVSVVWVGSPRPPLVTSAGPTGPSGSIAASGTSWPAEVTVPGSSGLQPVLSVRDAIGVRDGESAPREIAVGGWFVLNPVPCPLLPNGTSQLEDCIADYTWLMASPEDLSSHASDGSGSIHPPVGPGINPILAWVDWLPPTDGRPIPVVFAGHFHDSRASGCPAGDRRTRCEERFVVDSIVWASGVPNDLAAAPPSVLGLPDLAGLPTGAIYGLPVLSVSEAISVRAGGTSAEVAVKGWYWALTPGAIRCAAQPPRGVPFLEPSCGGRAWLMQVAESLTSQVGDQMLLRDPTGPAIEPAFAGATPPTVSGVPSTGSIPVPVVFVGHFNDRRSGFCTVGETLADAAAACRARFVVDGVAWESGHLGSSQVNDWRDRTGPLPTPMLNPRQNFGGLGTILSELVVTGEQIGQIEPGLTRPPYDLSSEPSLWVVTVLDPNPMPTGYKGVYLGGATIRTLVFTTSCAAYGDLGAGFSPMPSCPAQFPQSPGAS
jgi:hypothetical protein